MKKGPDELRLLERMAPGVLCAEGFIGPDPRPLGEIIDADRSRIESLGATREAIAGRLGEILERTVAGLGRDVDLGSGLTARWREGMGRIPCPWGDGVFPKGEIELTAPDGEQLRFTRLSVHLGRAHGFFQGRGTRYRLEPARLCARFDIP